MFSHLGAGKTAATSNTTTETKPAKPAKVEKTIEVKVEPSAEKTVEATPAAETKTVGALANVSTKALATLAGGGMGQSVLAAMTKEDQRTLAFPVLQLTGGNAGGSFTPIKAVPQEVADQMPQGKKPFIGYILGFRTEVVSWPVGYDEKEEDSKPVWTVAVPSDDPVGTDLVRKACKQYQFTKKDNKGKFDAATSGVGHIRPTLQLLVWLPDVEDLIVVQTPSHFESWRKTGEQLARNADPKTGEVLKFPAQFRPVSTVKQINGNTVTEHVIELTAMLNEAGAEVVKKFAAWREQAVQNPEVVAKVGEWVQALDAPRTPEIDAILKSAAIL